MKYEELSSQICIILLYLLELVVSINKELSLSLSLSLSFAPPLYEIQCLQQELPLLPSSLHKFNLKFTFVHFEDTNKFSLEHEHMNMNEYIFH